MPPSSPQQRIWILSELYAPELTSTGYFITRIAEYLASTPSRQVFAVASQPTYAARGTQAPRSELLHGVHVTRCWSPTLPKDRIWGRLGNLIVFTAYVSWVLLSNLRRGDIILSVTNPPPLPYVAAVLARLRGARMVLLIHDLYPEVLVPGGLLASNSLVVRLLHTTSAWLYRTSDRVVVLGRDMQQLIQAKIPPNERNKVSVIPNWASLDEVSHIPLSERLPSTPFTVQLAGNMGRGHNVEILFEAARRLPHIQFTFIGAGAKRVWLERTMAIETLTNVQIQDYRPRALLSHSLSDCDLAAIAFVPGMAGVSVPSRLYNVMASGRPIIAIAEADSELAMVVREEGIGWVVQPTDVDALVAILTRASQQRYELPPIGVQARHAAEERYSEQSVMRAYDSIFTNLA